MKACLVLALALVPATAGLPASYVKANEGLLWQSFKDTYKRVYSGEDEARRRSIFRTNMLKAAELESRNPRARFGMSPFSDLSEEEFKARHSRPRWAPVEASGTSVYSETDALAADTVDWRQKGAVTHVRNEGVCAGSYAFSAVGAIEGAWVVAGNSLTALSAQEAVDCSKYGCSGGFMDQVYKWLLQEKEGKIVTEQSYPYTGHEGNCHTAGKPVGAIMKRYTDIARDERAMASWVATKGPISVAVEASTWSSYNGGIMTNCPVGPADHAALVVGYGVDYWIIKNSWGPNWGEEGYIRIGRGTNQCNVTSASSGVEC